MYSRRDRGACKQHSTTVEVRKECPVRKSSVHSRSSTVRGSARLDGAHGERRDEQCSGGGENILLMASIIGEHGILLAEAEEGGSIADGERLFGDCIAKGFGQWRRDYLYLHWNYE